jgi:protease I
MREGGYIRYDGRKSDQLLQDCRELLEDYQGSLKRLHAAVAIAREFMEAGKPVAAICHGPQVLIATGLMAGRTATCYRKMAQELKASGVHYQDQAVVVDDKLITSRQPSDVPAFLRAIFTILGLD